MINKKVVVISTIISIILFILSALLYWLYSFLVFRVSSIDPMGTLPDSVTNIIITYNKNLKSIDQQPKDLVYVYPDKDISYIIDKNKLIINLKNAYNNGTLVTIRINNILSEDDKVISNSEYFYKVKFENFDKLSKQQQAIAVGESIIPEDSNPLLRLLPYSSSSSIVDEAYFLIEYKSRGNTGNSLDWKSKKNNYCVIINTNAADFYEEGTDNYIQLTKALRERAIVWIKKQGVDPSLDINYTFKPLSPEPELFYEPPRACI